MGLPLALLLFAGARVGAAFPDAWSKLSPSYVVAVEAGGALPIWRGRLALALDAAFTAPTADGTANAAGIGDYRYHLSAREVILGLSLVYRHALGRVVPYAGAGPRLVVFDAHVDGATATAKVPPSSDVSAGAGGGAFAGVAVALGPGELFADFRVDAAPVSARPSGSVVAGAIFVAGGYRVVF